MRFIFRIILPLIIIAFSGYLAWIYFVEPAINTSSPAGPYPYAAVPQENQVSPPATPPTESFPSAFVSVFNDPIVAFWIRNRDSEVYALYENGTIGKTNGLLSSQKLEGARGAGVSPDGDRVVVEFGGAAVPVFSVFEVDAKSWKPLPQGTTAAAWSPSGDRLAYLKETNGAATLVAREIATNKEQTLLSFSAVDLTLVWPEADTILLVDRPSREVSGTLWRYSIKNRRLDPVFQNEAGLVARWNAATGLKLGNNALSLVAPSGTIIKTFSFRTLPSKCAWNSTKMFCAIPRDLDSRVLPDDYLKRKNTSSDDLYEVSASALGRRIMETSYDMDDLVLRGNTLYFINRYDGKLYALLIANR